MLLIYIYVCMYIYLRIQIFCVTICLPSHIKNYLVPSVGYFFNENGEDFNLQHLVRANDIWRSMFEKRNLIMKILKIANL
jgi:hypothetical protein